jgi:hypothetical protein
MATLTDMRTLNEAGIPIEFKMNVKDKAKAASLHAKEALGGKGGIAPTHSRPRH